MLRTRTHRPMTRTVPTPARRPGRTAVLVLALGLLAAACGGTATTGGEVTRDQVLDVAVDAPATPAPATAVDLAAIRDYWEQRNTAFATGADVGIAFVLANLPTGLDYTAEQCATAWFGGPPPVGFAERSTLDETTVQVLTDWSMTGGPLDGVAQGAGIHRMEVDVTYTGARPLMDRRIGVVLSARGGDVRNYVRCEAPTPVAPSPATLVGTVPVSQITGGGAIPTPASCPSPRIDVQGDTAYIYCPITSTTTPTVPTDGTVVTPVAPAPTPVPTPAPAPAPDTGDGGTPAEPQPGPPNDRAPDSGLDFCADEGATGAAPGDYRDCGDETPA